MKINQSQLKLLELVVVRSPFECIKLTICELVSWRWDWGSLPFRLGHRFYTLTFYCVPSFFFDNLFLADKSPAKPSKIISENTEIK